MIFITIPSYKDNIRMNCKLHNDMYNDNSLIKAYIIETHSKIIFNIQVWILHKQPPPPPIVKKFTAISAMVFGGGGGRGVEKTCSTLGALL